MMPKFPEPARDLRVVASHIDLEGISGRVLFPTPTQGPWLPFLRYAETVTAGGGDDAEGHTHQDEEVLNYIVSGRAEYEDHDGRRSTLGAGTVELLLARDETRHMLKGENSKARTRWISIVVRGPRPPPVMARRFQIARTAGRVQTSGPTAQRVLVGAGSPLTSTVGLECKDLEFANPGRCVCSIPPGRRAVAYVFEGHGKVTGQDLPASTGVLLDNIETISIDAEKGSRLLLASVPRTGIP